MVAWDPDLISLFKGGEGGNVHVHFHPPYILYKYITYLALKTMIVQNNIKHIYIYIYIYNRVGGGGGGGLRPPPPPLPPTLLYIYV